MIHLPRLHTQALRTLLLAGGCLLISDAGAAIVFVGDGNPNASQYYLSQAYAEIKNASNNNLADAGEIRSSASPVPAASQTGTLSQSGTSVAYNATVSLDAFGRARSLASLSVANTQLGALVGGYNAIATVGARTQASFNAGPLTPGRAVFNFSVTGSSVDPYGTAFARLDFLARPFVPGGGSFFDVFGASDPYTFGPRNYSFTYTGSFASPLDILFYAGAGVLVGVSDPFGGPIPPNGSSFTSVANYASTFDLTSIDLFAEDGARINSWTLTDLASNTAVFNQEGRVRAAVPEPATLALLSLGLAALGLARRRSQSHIPVANRPAGTSPTMNQSH